MLARTIAFVLLVPSLAFAEETGGASADVEGEIVAHGDAAYGSARLLGAAEHDVAWDFYHLIVAGNAVVEARGGAESPISAHGEGTGFFGDVDAPGVETAGLMATTVDVTGDLEVLPGLDARRDVHRRAYSRGSATMKVVGLRGGDGRVRWEAVEVGMGTALSVQADDELRLTHREETMHGTFARRCRLRARPAPDRCITIIPFDAIGVTGGSEAAIGTFYPATWSGVGIGGDLYASFGIGGGGTGTMTTEQDGQVVDVIETEDLPNVSAAVGFAEVSGRIGDVELDVRAARDFYVTIDGDLALDDRVRAEVRWTHDTSSWRARAFAARTLWWTTRSDPGQRETTGGVEVGVRRPVRFVEVDASVGAARSFYGVLDGNAADRAGVAGTARLTLRRNVRTVTW